LTAIDFFSHYNGRHTLAARVGICLIAFLEVDYTENTPNALWFESGASKGRPGRNVSLCLLENLRERIAIFGGGIYL